MTHSHELLKMTLSYNHLPNARAQYLAMSSLLQFVSQPIILENSTELFFSFLLGLKVFLL